MDGRRLRWQGYFFLILICFAFFVPGLVSLPPTDRDESLFSQASKQMIETGNYVDIRIQNQPRYKKPIGIYWLQALSVRLFNPDHLNEIWAYRLPSLLGATLAVVMTAALGTLFFGPLTGVLAALMMAGCLVLNVEARLAKTDAALLGTIMVAQYALARAYRLSIRSCFVPIVFWTALGAGILIKGPIILLVVASTLIWVRVTEKNLTWAHSLKPLWGIPYVLLLTAPWFIAIAMQSHGQFIHDAGGQDFLAKIWQGQNRGILPPGLHFMVMPAVFFPFSLFILLAIPDVWKLRDQVPYPFLLGWAVPVWIVFELSLTKLPHYVLPVYPALALMAAQALVKGYPAWAECRRPWLWGVAVAVWLIVGISFAMLMVALPQIIDRVWSDGTLFVSGLMLLSMALSVFYLVKRRVQSIFVLVTGSLVFMTYTFGSTLPLLHNLWITRQIMEAASLYKPCPVFHIVSASYDEPSLILMAGTQTTFSPDGAVVADALKKEGCTLGLLDTKHEGAFLSAFPPSEQQPLAVAHMQGFNIGAGRSSDLTLYLMPLH